MKSKNWGLERASLGFVAVPAVPSWPPPTGALQIELSRADGTRLCLHGVEAP